MYTIILNRSMASREKMMKAPSLFICLLVGILLLAFTAYAQAPPDAGQLLRDMQRELVAPARPAPPVIAVEKLDPESTPANVRFAVKTVHVTGSSIFPAAELEALVADLVGKDNSMADVLAAARRITTHYRERGYPVARGYVPAQEIIDGVLTLAVLEGKLGKMTIINKSALSDRYVNNYMGGISEGSVIEAAPLNRALLLLADIPGTGEIKANIRPGDRVGTSDLVVQLTQGPRFAGEISGDNYGNRFTGQYRLSGRLDANNFTRLGDRLSLRATASDEQLAYGRLAWDFPLGAQGLRLGGAYTMSRYELAKDFAPLKAHGTANTASLYGAYPLLRSLPVNVNMGVSLEDRRLKDHIDAFATAVDKHAQAALVDLNGDFNDSLGGGATNYWQLAATFGDLSINSPAQLTIDQATAQTHGAYQKVIASFARLQRLASSTSAYLAISGQLAGKNLDSSEKFVLGGAYGVRAYPQGEADGDNGWLATIELRQNFLPWLQGTLFYDAGGVKINHSPFTAGTNTRDISGYGIGANAAYGAFSLRTSVAWRATAGPTSDEDRIPRIWALVSWRF